MSAIKEFIVENLSFLGKYKRWYVAFKDTKGSVRKSYSQYGEDVDILQWLKDYDLQDAIYVDVGANHPTDISNTFLLYQHGMRGVVVEPNEELIGLFRKFRKRDIAMGIGCSNQSAVLKFNISKTPVLSSFSNDRGMSVDRHLYLPVMPLDAALSNIDSSLVCFLSIDVEGLNVEVLEGAKQTLAKTLLVCIEYDEPDEQQKFEALLGPDFELIKTVHCNLIYRNKILDSKYRKK